MDLSELNPMQRKAAETLEGPVLILAGAGSGKTRTLTYRIANLLQHGVQPWHILALTFTNKAAQEMNRRVRTLTGENCDDMWIGTFHSICCRILRRDIDKLGYERSFTIYDEDDQSRLLKHILKDLHYEEKSLPVKEISRAISDAKNQLQTADEWFSKSDRRYRDQCIHTVFVEYDKRLKAANALDFDDLIMKTLQLFMDHPPVLAYYQQRFLYVSVDEYQDTNYAQYQLVLLLTGKNRNLCVVGDDDQSIYGWRGADIRNILEFERDFPDTAVIKLEQNYRSTANILDAANQVIAHNRDRKDKALWTDGEAGEPIILFRASDEREEAAYICRSIRQQAAQGVHYGHMAVLYRMHALSRVLEETLVQMGIPYQIFGGTRFYDRKEVKDALAYLRILQNPLDQVSLLRVINVPKRAIGDSTVEALRAYALSQGLPLWDVIQHPPQSLGSRAQKSVMQFANLLEELRALVPGTRLSALVDTVTERSGLRAQFDPQKEEDQSRLENLKELVGAAGEFERKSETPTLDAFLENVSLITDLDRQEETPHFVTLMTMHSAKGLEFDTVFIAAMEENIFPSARAVQEENRLEEERRLCYVAITRARKRLILTLTRRRMLFNQPQYNGPSQFIKEIPSRLLREEGSAAPLSGQPRFSSGSYGGKGMRRPQRDVYDEELPQAGYRDDFPGGIPPRRVSPSRPAAVVSRGTVPSRAAGLTARLFQPGDTVLHRKFGRGTVQQITGEGANAHIVIRFAIFGEKTFSLDIAPIIKLEE